MRQRNQFLLSQEQKWPECNVASKGWAWGVNEKEIINWNGLTAVTKAWNESDTISSWMNTDTKYPGDILCLQIVKTYSLVMTADTSKVIHRGYILHNICFLAYCVPINTRAHWAGLIWMNLENGKILISILTKWWIVMKTNSLYVFIVFWLLGVSGTSF